MNYFLMLLPLIVLAICFAIRIPIGFSMFCASIIYFIASGQSLGILLNVSMSNLYSASTLVVVPLFIFAGNVMNSSKVTEYMFTFTKSLIGKRRGATAYINIVLSLIFAGMTGSAMADACGLGILEVEEMRKDGYDDPFSCAITAATSTVGPIFPPSIGMVIYGMLAGVSVGSLFMGGVIPAFIMCTALGVYVWYISKKRKYPMGVSFTFKEFLRYTWKALPALLTPVLLLGGMYTGIVTCTEAGALAGLYVIIISLLVYRTLGFKDLMRIIKETTIQTGYIMFVALAAWVFSHVIASTGLDEVFHTWFISITNSKYVFLLFVNVALLILGMFFDTLVIQFVFLPLLIPIAIDLGVNLIHFGVITLVNMTIGLISPPYGTVCITVSALNGVSLNKTFKEVLPMMGILIVVLFLITYIPDVVLLMPNLLS